MLRYTDPSNPQFMERFNALQSFYSGKGYDLMQLTRRVNGVTGMIKLQAFFKSMSQAFQIAVVVCLVLIAVIFVLWICRTTGCLLIFLHSKIKRMKMQKLYHQKLNSFLVILFLAGSQSCMHRKLFQQSNVCNTLLSITHYCRQHQLILQSATWTLKEYPGSIFQG
jgi:hypothetical protein